MASASSSVLRARAGSLRQAQAFFARKTPLEKEWAGALRIGAESLTGRAVRMDHTRAGLTGARTMATATLDTSDLPPIPDKRLTRLIPRTKRHPVPQDTAESIVGLIVNEPAPANATQQRETEAQVYQLLEDSKQSSASLRQLAAAVLQLSRDKDRNLVASRLYAMAYRRGDDDAGYSWATMVLEGMVPNEVDSTTKQVDDAMRLYADLARKGHAQSLFGMGRYLLAQATREPETAEKRVPRAIELWQRAGKSGMPDAWYELGRMYEAGELVPQDKDNALTCFEHGARAGSSLSCYALGVLHAERANKAHESGDAKASHSASTLANRYFLQAAQKGHAPSAYNMGVRYLLRDATDDASTPEQRRSAHQAQWGIVPDDRSAREWFDFMPAMMNYGAMLVDGRGATTNGPTADDLFEAKRVYRRVLVLGQVAQQNPSLLPGRATGDTPEVMKHMVQQAEHALQHINTLQPTSPDELPPHRS